MLDQNLFIEELATFMATAASVAHASTPRQLWLYKAGETAATPAYSVMRPYTGRRDFVSLGEVSIQVETIGEDDEAIALAWKLFKTLVDAQGRPLRNTALTSHRINGIRNLQTPGLIGRDSDQRAKLVFNFDATYVALS